MDESLTASMRARIVREENARAARKRDLRERRPRFDPLSAAEDEGEVQIVFARPAPVVEEQRVAPRWKRAQEEAERAEAALRRRVEAAMGRAAGKQ